MNPSPTALPRLLLVEDDPVSAAFLREAAAALPALVDVACWPRASSKCCASRWR